MEFAVFLNEFHDVYGHFCLYEDNFMDKQLFFHDENKLFLVVLTAS